MTNPTITVTLSSLAVGTKPTVTEIVEATEGQQVDVSVTWPTATNNTIQCELDFSNSGDQDPFNDITGGSTSFNLVGSGTTTQTATHTLTVETDASVTTDSYDLTLTIDGQTYSTDPKIIVDED